MNGSKNHLFLLLSLVCLLILMCNASPSVIDLTYTFDENTPSHPKLAKFDLRAIKRGLDKFGNWVEMNDFFTSEHTGTHIDAPAHFSKNGLTVNQIPVEKLYRVPGVMMDVRNRIRQNINYEIKPQDIEDWMDIYGRLPDGCVILFQTGWGKRAFSPAAYSGMDQFGKLNFPGLGRAAAEWIVRYGNQTFQRHGVLGVGIDTISLDVGSSFDYPVHATLLGNGIYGLENVDNLEHLPPRGFTLTMLPMKIGEGSAAPVRIIAERQGVSYAQALVGSSPSVVTQNVFSTCSTAFLLLLATSRMLAL